MRSALVLILLLGAACVSVSPAGGAREPTASQAETWVQQVPLPRARGGMAVAWIEDRLVAAGGSYWQEGVKHWTGQVDAYDPERRQWEPLPPIPQPAADGGTATDGRSLFLVGGAVEGKATSACWRLCRRKREWNWERLPDLPSPRAYGTAFCRQDRLYLTGGCADPGNLRTATAECLELDLRTATPGWRKIAPLPAPARCLAAGAVAGDRLLLFGGCVANEAGKPVNLAETLAYQPERDRWERGADLPVGLRGACAVALGGQRVSLFGGYSGGPDDLERLGPAAGFERRVWIFEWDRFRAAAPLPAPVAGAGCAIGDGKVYLAGGEDQARSRTQGCWSAPVRRLLTGD